MQGGAAIPDGSAVTSNFGTLALNASETIGSLEGTGAVTLGANTLTTGGNNTSTIYGGAISGTGGLTKTGSGTMTLAGANSYTGTTTISQGTLQLGVAATFATAADVAEWFDAADASTITTAGGAVSQWRDKSGNARHLNQGTAANQPRHLSNALNGRSVVRFDGDDVLSNTYNVNNPYTILSVARYNEADGDRVVAGTSNNWLLGFHGNMVDRFHPENWVATGMAADTALHFYGATGGDNQSTFFDGSRFIARNANALAAPNGLSLGAGNGNPAYEASRADVAEVLVFSRILSPARMAEALGYLNAKWRSANAILADAAPVTVGGSGAPGPGPRNQRDDRHAERLGQHHAGRHVDGERHGHGNVLRPDRRRRRSDETGQRQPDAANTNAYTGPTTINAGTLVAATSGALGAPGGVINNAATLGLAGGVTLANCTINMLAGSTTPNAKILSLAAGNVLAATVVLNGDPVNPTPLTLESQAGTLTVNCDINLNLSPLVADGAGNVTINGRVLGYTAGATVPAINTLGLLTTGDYTFTAGGQTFTGRVDNDGTNSWLLVGRGRAAWDFDTDGQGDPGEVNQFLGTTTAFAPAAYSDALVNALLARSGIDLRDVEVRIRRAEDTPGTAYQESRWRDFTATTGRGSFNRGRRR